jgi:hypothetical protein
VVATYLGEGAGVTGTRMRDQVAADAKESV